MADDADKGQFERRAFLALAGASVANTLSGCSKPAPAAAVLEGGPVLAVPVTPGVVRVASVKTAVGET